MVQDLSPLDFYAGAFRHAIDEKNRITIRAQWRRKEVADNGEEKGETFVILPGPNLQYLLVMRPNEFAQLTTTAKNSPDVTPSRARKFLRQVHARAQVVASDKQGRLVLPVEMCSLLDLKGEVMLVGGEARLEVWNLGKWKVAYQQETPVFDEVSDAIGL